MMKMHKKSLLTALFLGAVTITAPVFAQDIQSGLKDLESERLAKAEQTFTQLAASAPTAENQFYLGYYYLKTGQSDKAKAAFEKGLATDPANQLNNVGLAGVALAKKDGPGAKALIDASLKATKNKNMDVLYRAGEMYTLNYDYNARGLTGLGTNDPAEALRLLDMATKLDKKNSSADIKMVMGDAYFIKNDGGNSVSRYEDALLISPNLAEANYKIGRLYLRGKQYKLAQEFFTKAIENDAEFAPTYRALAEALASSRAYKGAAKNAELYVQKSGTTDPEYLTNVAKYYFLSNDYLKAISYLDQLKGKVNDPIIDRMYGWAYSALGKNDQAIQALSRFVTNAPTKVIYDDYKYLGRAYGQLGTPEGDSLSVVYLEKAAPSDTLENLYREIGAKYYSAKRWDKAAQYYKQVVAREKKPLNSDFVNLGLANYQQAPRAARDIATTDTLGRQQALKTYYLRADSAFAKLTEQAPEYAPSYYYRGFSNYYAYSRAEALTNGTFVPYLEKYIEMTGKEIAADASKREQYKRNLITTYKTLAGYAISKKDEAKAKEYATKVLELDPNDKDSKALIEGPQQPEPAKAAPAPAPAAKAPVKKSTK